VPRILSLLLILVASFVLAQDKPLNDIDRLRQQAAELRKAAVADPTIKSVMSPPVRAYLTERDLQRLISEAGLKQRIEQIQNDKTKAELLTVLKDQLAELMKKPLDQLSFDAAYGYLPTTGLVGYSKRVRLLENTSDGKSIVQVENIALLVPGMETSQYPSGKFLRVDKAILVGPKAEKQIVQGAERLLYTATLVDLEAVLRTSAAEPPPQPSTARPKVPGKLRLTLRERKEQPAGSGKVVAVERTVDWNVAETAIIVCDMWDAHHCQIAAQRVGVLAPQMNRVLTAARDHGVMIIHAPSETMDVYASTPNRLRMQQATYFRPPVPIERRCDTDPTREPAPLPVDRRLDCDDPTLGPVGRKHTKQHAAIDIIGFDGVSDNGEEIYNFCEQEGIKNIVLMGVHTNYCILARSFGIRQMVRLGRTVVLARDMTDALYDPRQPPYVSHARGTELVVEHIERYWCPSILSADLTHVVPGSDGP